MTTDRPTARLYLPDGRRVDDYSTAAEAVRVAQTDYRYLRCEVHGLDSNRLPTRELWHRGEAFLCPDCLTTDSNTPNGHHCDQATTAPGQTS